MEHNFKQEAERLLVRYRITSSDIPFLNFDLVKVLRSWFLAIIANRRVI